HAGVIRAADAAHADMVLDVVHAQAVVHAVFDGMLGVARGHGALQRDNAIADLHRYVADIQAAVAEALANVFAHPLVGPDVALGRNALRTVQRRVLPAVAPLVLPVPPGVAIVLVPVVVIAVAQLL